MQQAGTQIIINNSNTKSNMADETQVEKHYCYSCPSDNNALIGALMSSANKGTDASTLMAMMNNNGWQNNPFMYLIWLAFFGGGNGFGWGNRADAAQTTAENYNSRAIAQLQDSVNNNHSNDIALAAINGNRDALGQLAQTFNADINAITAAVGNVRSAIEQVGGQVGYSAESVKNAIAIGDSDIISKMQSCCCENKLMVQQSNYENQLATERQTNMLGSKADMNHAATMARIDQLANGVQTGFAQLGYQSQQNTQAIISNATANTQRILDQMCANTTQQLRDTIADKDRQLQTQTLLNQLGSGCSCNS